MNKSAIFFDVFLSLCIVWLFSLCLFRHVGTPLTLAVALSFLCGVCISVTLGFFWKRKRHIIILKRSKQQEKEKLMLHLALLKDADLLSIFTRAFKHAYPNTPQVRQNTAIQAGDEQYFFCFRFRPLCQDDIAPFAKTMQSNQTTYLLCGQMEEPAFQLCKRLNIQVQTGDWVYMFLQEHECLPKQYVGENVPLQKGQRLHAYFSKRNANRFLKCGFCVLFLALFTPFRLYYVLFGAILLLLALCIRLFGYTTSSKP